MGKHFYVAVAAGSREIATAGADDDFLANGNLAELIDDANSVLAPGFRIYRFVFDKQVHPKVKNGKRNREVSR